MPNDRPPIPADVKREIRTRCGFGCAVCGLPIYDYEHILGWAATMRHVASEMTLLCPQHHREKTVGLLTVGQVTAADRDPCNPRRGMTRPYGLNFGGAGPVGVGLGSNIFLSSDAILAPYVVDDRPIVIFHRDGDELFLSLDLRDEMNLPVVMIDRNSLAISTNSWDAEFSGRVLTVREAARKALVQIRFEPPNLAIIERARILMNGVELVIDARGIRLNGRGVTIKRSRFHAAVGITVGVCPTFPIAVLPRVHVNRYNRTNLTGGT